MPEDPPSALGRDVALAPLTTLEVGGPAQLLVEATAQRDIVRALRNADTEDLPVTVLGGGSNVVIADEGVGGLVLRIELRGIELERRGEDAFLTAAAGEPWDDLVARAVEEGLTGIECLSGIPGTVGATPIQNVGAYGAEVSDVVDEVLVLDRAELKPRRLRPAECSFGYRSSVFRREPERYIVLAVTYRLRPWGAPVLRYPELAQRVAERCDVPTLADVRSAVIELRRSKSMVIEAEDPNRRSVGSFFVNPVVADDRIEEIAQGGGVAADEVPRFPAGPGAVKVPAAWLIERCGFSKGERRGRVGISSRHALALVHHGDGSAAELVAFAREIRAAVRDRFDIDLKPEPVFLGFGVADPTE